MTRGLAIPPLKRILLVEDEMDIRTVAKLALEVVGGLEVVPCSSGAQALSAAVAAQPDLLLLDVMMPGMDGPTTLRALRDLPDMADVPAIFLTAKAQPHEVAALCATGAIAVLTKPFDPMSLADTLRSIWRTHHGGE
jgi:CheY-like chemotaxis protein